MTESPRIKPSPILYLIALLYGLKFSSFLPTDPDLGWQLFGGAWLSDHGALPSFDPVNSLNHGWHNYHWLAQLFMFQIYKVGGYPALGFILGLIMAYLFTVILDICFISIGRRCSNLFVAVFFTASSLFIGCVASIRPQMVAILLIAITLRRLIQKPVRLEFPFLFCIGVILANFHVYWIFVPILWFNYRVLPAIIRRKAPSLHSINCFLALLLAGTITPYSCYSYLLIYDYLAMPDYLRSSIREFQRAFSIGGPIPYVLLLYALCFVRTFRLKNAVARSGNAVTALIGFCLAVRGIKFIALFAPFGIPYLIRESGLAVRKYAPNIFKRDHMIAHVVFFSLITVATAGLIHDLIEDPDLKTLSEQYPIEACAKLATLNLPILPGRDHLRILTHFNHGGWCRWSAYLAKKDLDIRVTTDGRTQDARVEDYKRSFELYFLSNQDWRKTLKEWDPDAVIVARDNALSQILPLMPDWKELYQDKNFALFAPIRG